MKLLSTALAVLVAVLASYAVGASAGRGDLARDAQREPVYVPQPAPTFILQCGEVRSIALVSHWPTAFHTEYVVQFTASGQPGTIQVRRNQPEYASVSMTLPPPDPRQPLSLTVPVGHPAGQFVPVPHWIEVSAGAFPCEGGEGKPDVPLVLDINNLNIFVR